MPRGDNPMSRWKAAAKRIGCTLDHYLAQRAAGLRWCSYCRSWQAKANHGQCVDCKRAEWRAKHPPRPRKLPPPRERDQRGRLLPTPPPAQPPHPPQRWCSCEWCAKSRSDAA